MSVKDMRKFMTATAMSKEEIDEFSSTPRIARMATIKEEMLKLESHNHT